MSTLNINGRKRPTLSEQIQRLDTILDGLADNLNEAVASAVKEAVGIAVQEAVRAVLTEVLANPELLAKLRPEPTPKSEPVAVASPVAPKKPGWLTRLGALLVVGWGCTVRVAQRASAKIAQAARWLWNVSKERLANTYQRGKGLAQLGVQWCVRSMSALRGFVRKPVAFSLGLGSLAALVARRFKMQLLTALGVGIAVGTTTYFAGPWLAAGVSAAGGFATTLAVHAGLWLRRTFGVSAVTNA